MHALLSGMPRRRSVLVAASVLAALAARPVWAQGGAARRIVSVGGALTETLYLLGAQGELVGVDTTSLYPAVAQKLPSVGYARALSAEGLLSLRPTLVVAGAEAGPPVVLRQLEAARVPLVVLDDGHRAEGLFARTAKLGELIGRGAEGQALARQQQAEWAATLARVATLADSTPGTQGAQGKPGKPAQKVLFVLSHSMAQVRIGGSGTAADAVITYAGAVNAVAELEGFKPLTPEAAIAAAPDVILCTEQGLSAAGGIDGLLKAPGLAATPAGRARRVFALEAQYLLGFGPRLPQAVAQLAGLLHAGPKTA